MLSPVYADDTKIFMALQPGSDYFAVLSTCVDDVSRWLPVLENGMLLNPTKTDAMLCGTHAQRQKVDVSSGIDVAGAHVSFSGTIKLISVELDSALSMDGHVFNVVSGCNYHIRALRRIRPLLDLDTARCSPRESLPPGLITATA